MIFHSTIFFFGMIRIILLFNVTFDKITLIGYECQSSRNCFKADIFRNESITVSPNMGICVGCACICNHSNELPKQGNHFFKHFLII